MTEKRFMVDDAGTLIDMQTRDMFDIVEEVVDLLNELHEENNGLKQSISDWQGSYDELYEDNLKLEKENKEFKKQMNRLYNYFMDWYSDEMGGNQFSEMWDIVKESEEWEEKW